MHDDQTYEKYLEGE